MTYAQYKERKLTTNAELIAALQKLPLDATLSIADADLGGYDICIRPYGEVSYDKESNTISITHMEYELYEAVEKGEITHKEYEELNGEYT